MNDSLMDRRMSGGTEMKYKCALIVVEDMERSRKFYENLLGQRVILDFGANITFEGDFCLQTRDSWEGFIGAEKPVTFRPNNFELYFEEVQFEQFALKLKNTKEFNVELIHDVKEYPWGQHVIRFYDPDHHIIEVGESMASVVLRFYNQGMTPDEIAEQTQHPRTFVDEVLNDLR
jgi:catechol 2,3-dioxygenase-like lactoylglutathione lyase family enzyme